MLSAPLAYGYIKLFRGYCCHLMEKNDFLGMVTSQEAVMWSADVMRSVIIMCNSLESHQALDILLQKSMTVETT